MTPSKPILSLCVCGDPLCNIPYGCCHCKCGGRTSISKCNDTFHGYKKFQPKKFLPKHQNRIDPIEEGAMPFKIDGVYCRLIPLGRGFYAIVDAADCEWLMELKWTVYRNTSNGLYYAIRQCTHLYKKGLKPKDIKMSRMILGLESGDKLQAEHKNGSTLDNRRANLRRATNSQNQMNGKMRNDNTTGYKGVSREKGHLKYRAQIYINGKSKHLGLFVTAIEAHEVYKAAALIYYGEFARTEG